VRQAVSVALARVFSTRYGLALLIAIVVLGIVGAARLVAGPAAAQRGPSADGLPAATVNPTAGDDGEFSAPPTPQVVISPGTAPPDRVAAAFAAAWLDHRGVTAQQWLARLKPHATPHLVDELTGVDPAGVPAERATGPVDLVPRGERLIDAAIPVDSGTLRLRLVATDGRWYVDGIDWDRG
jgi:hypothetical protein